MAANILKIDEPVDLDTERIHKNYINYSVKLVEEGKGQECSSNFEVPLYEKNKMKICSHIRSK
jgi:hypothetical protein